MKITNFLGEVTDLSAKNEALVLRNHHTRKLPCGAVILFSKHEVVLGYVYPVNIVFDNENSLFSG